MTTANLEKQKSRIPVKVLPVLVSGTAKSKHSGSAAKEQNVSQNRYFVREFLLHPAHTDFNLNSISDNHIEHYTWHTVESRILEVT